MLLFNPFPLLIYSDVEHYNSQSSSNFPTFGGLFDVIHYVTSALLVKDRIRYSRTMSSDRSDSRARDSNTARSSNCPLDHEPFICVAVKR